MNNKSSNINSVSDDLADIKAYLMDHRSEICGYFYTTNKQWNDFALNRNCRSEKLWVFLISCGYALGKEQGVKTLAKVLTSLDLEQPAHPMIWFEALPLPPRMREGNTHLDLALGAIASRNCRNNGIMFDDSVPSWICFCEAKLESDISLRVTHDPKRNQLARVIENAICFQNSAKYADDVYVTVITLRASSHKYPLLKEKFDTYRENPDNLVNDLAKCCLDKRDRDNWLYPPNLTQRITDSLKLGWVYFEDLLKNIPSSDISEQLKNLWSSIY